MSASSPVSYEGAKLYYHPNSCGAACYIAAYSAGLKGLQTEQVDLKTHQTSSGKDFYSINPKGNVPALVLADGTLLNEGSAILQFIADQKPEAKLGAAWGSVERYRLQNALNHIASEVHPAFGQAFFANDSNREFLLARMNKKLAYLDKEIKGQYYVNDHFTVADVYLYVVLSWHPWIQGASLDTYPAVKKYYEFLKDLPQVVESLKLMAGNSAKLE